MQAAKTAVEKLDILNKAIIDFANKHKFHLLITADHGNCEEMGTSEHPNTAHTTNFVPFRYIKDGKVQKTKASGGLSDIAPTILSLMKIAIPQEMTGKSLI